jgi:hypothetical protein
LARHGALRVLRGRRRPDIYTSQKTWTYERTETDWGYLDRGNLYSWNGVFGGTPPFSAGGRYSWGQGAAGAPSATGSQHQRAMRLHTCVNSDIFLNTTASRDWLFLGAEIDMLPEPYPHTYNSIVYYLQKYRARYHFNYTPYRELGQDWPHPDTGVVYELLDERAFAMLDLRWPGGASL